MDVMNEGMKQCAGGAFLGARECAWVCEELQDAGDAATAKSAEIQKLSEAGGRQPGPAHGSETLVVGQLLHHAAAANGGLTDCQLAQTIE